VGDALRMGGATLRLGVTPMLYEVVVLPVLPKLLERHPDLLLTLEIGISDSVSDWLLREQVELGLASLLDSHPGIEAEPLVSTHSVCVIPADHPLAALDQVGPEDLAPYDLVTMTRRFSSRHRIEQLFRKAGVPLRLRVETNVAGTILDMVRAGSGVAILNGLSWIPRMNSELVARPFHPTLHHRYGFLHIADRGLSAVARDLTALVREHARATLPDAYVDSQG
jgi:DNA-binding transcriptional LysR family regulator